MILVYYIIFCLVFLNRIPWHCFIMSYIIQSQKFICFDFFCRIMWNFVRMISFLHCIVIKLWKWLESTFIISTIIMKCVIIIRKRRYYLIVSISGTFQEFWHLIGIDKWLPPGSLRHSQKYLYWGYSVFLIIIFKPSPCIYLKKIG